MLSCHHCGFEVERKVSRLDSCQKCGYDLYVCENCRFRSTNTARECSEPRAEIVRDKTRANFCGWFQERQTRGGGAKTVASNEQDAARKALEALFKR
ncbi:MAG: hypothetical protein HZA20_08945 [Nitrospirae bacterium]|nr:hypothetical protein [Nitrospirota bacterium]